jgi:hypothetical protein
MPSTLVKPCLKPHKIPKNFLSDEEEEDNAMLLDMRRETKKTKKRKKTQNLKIQLLQLHIDIIGSNNSKQFTMLLHFTTIFIHILRLLLLLLQVV